MKLELNHFLREPFADFVEIKKNLKFCSLKTYSIISSFKAWEWFARNIQCEKTEFLPAFQDVYILSQMHYYIKSNDKCTCIII